MTRRLIIAALLSALVAAASAAPASAHATLEATTPESGASLASAPPRVVLRFDEPVETALSRLRVSDARGREVQQGSPFHPGGDATALAVRLPPRLPMAGYVATFRVVSADSHPASGGFTFDVGGAAQPSALLARERGGRVTAAALGAARAIQYAAISLALGVLCVLLVAWLPAIRTLATPGAPWREASDAFARRARRLLLAAAAAGTASASAAIALQGATVAGTSLWSSLGDAPEVLSTRFGTVWGVGALAWLAVFTIVDGNDAVVPVLRPATVGATGVALGGTGVWLRAATVPVLALAFLPGLSGHAAARPPVALSLPANVLHVLAAGAWIGGLAVLVLALPAATRRLPGPERGELLAAVLARFSTLALAAVVVLLAAGVVQSLRELGALGDLLGTAFGRAVAAKLVLGLALVACGAVNRRRTVPALRRAAADGVPDERASRRLRRTLRAELALGVAALAISGVLAGYQPQARNSDHSGRDFAMSTQTTQNGHGGFHGQPVTSLPHSAVSGSSASTRWQTFSPS
jgi:copper transport protein